MTRRSLLAAAAARKPRVAVVMNTYFPNSHADVFVGRLLDGYRLNGVSHRPRLETVSFYCDQFPINDMAREQAAEFGVKIYPTVEAALRRGGTKLAVDGVAVIGEHGDYARTPRGNVMYPRARYFDAVTKVFREDGRVLPLLNDKYFAYEWADARRMYETVRALKIPFACGSTLPLTWRRPPLEFAAGTKFDELLAVSFSDLEEHAYHAIELLQGMAERRGETGVARVRYVAGSQATGLTKPALLEAALATRVNGVPKNATGDPEAFEIEYRDGLRAVVLNLNAQSRDYLFAASVNGQVKASCFYIQLWVHNHWSFMVKLFEDLVLTGRNPNPIERTLYANGIMLAGLESRLRRGAWIDTPELAVRYGP